MIFVTIGSALPFDRLVRAVDAWAGEHPDVEILAQIGDGAFEPQHMRWVRTLPRAEYDAAVAAADLIVAHAGMGSAITAGEYGKSIVLLPRRADLGEHRNDHQADTAGWLRDRAGIQVAGDETELAALIDGICLSDTAEPPAVQKTAPPEFIEKIRAFVLG